MYTKAKIYNLALGALLLTKRVADVNTDPSTEVQTLNVHYDTALRSTLADLDLDGTSCQQVLELVETNPNPFWQYSYKYPTNCSFFRRIQSTVLKDNRSTQIPRRVAVLNNIKVILTNHPDAVGEYIPHDLNLSVLSASAGLAIAHKLAMLAAPLVAGKNASNIMKLIQSNYMLAKAEAQELDRLENANFDDDEITSEFVETRLS